MYSINLMKCSFAGTFYIFSKFNEFEFTYFKTYFKNSCKIVLRLCLVTSINNIGITKFAGNI